MTAEYDYHQFRIQDEVIRFILMRTKTEIMELTGADLLRHIFKLSNVIIIFLRDIFFITFICGIFLQLFFFQHYVCNSAFLTYRIIIPYNISSIGYYSL